MRHGLLLALGSVLLLHCGETERTAKAPGPYSLIEHIEDAETKFDETAFRSQRKDGRLVNAVTMGSRTERALTPPLPSELTFEVELPDAPVLSFSTGARLLGDEELPASIELGLFVEADGKRTRVFSDLIRRRAANQWRDHEVDLAAWGGRGVGLTLAGRFRTSGDVEQPVLVSWGDPVVADPTRPPDRPTLVLVSIDCLRADHVGAYGYPEPTTPHVDAVAAEGTLFENAFSTASWTLPSHMSMLTGLLPSLHGATKWEKLSSSLDYLPELLSRAGYRTAGIVSWVYLSQVYGFERGFDFYEVLDDPEASDIVDLAIEQLRRGRGGPQFLFVHLYDPHWPYLPPPEFSERFGGRPRDISTLLEMTSTGKEPSDRLQIEEVARLYDGETAFADRELGRFIEALKKEGLYDGALVIITADHGEAFYEHGHWQHSDTLYEEIIRIPLVVKWPKSRTGSRVSHPVSLVDVYATLAAAAGVDLPESEEGVFARQPLGTEPRSDRTILSEVTWRSPSGTFMKVAFRNETVKYIATLSGPTGDDLGVNEVTEEELYDLVSDPDERENLLSTDPSRAQPFRSELRSFLEAAKNARSLRQGEAVELDEATLEKLKSLGYVH